jgi:hypothetical protein
MGTMMAKQMAATIAQMMAKRALSAKLFKSTVVLTVVGNGGSSCNSGNSKDIICGVLLLRNSGSTTSTAFPRGYTSFVVTAIMPH